MVDFVGLLAVDELAPGLPFFCASEVLIGGGAGVEEENLELILVIHDDLVGVFSAELARLRKPGRRLEDEEERESAAFDGGGVEEAADDDVAASDCAFV